MAHGKEGTPRLAQKPLEGAGKRTDADSDRLFSAGLNRLFDSLLEHEAQKNKICFSHENIRKMPIMGILPNGL